MGKKPNFFLVGAPKSGTTSLYHYLKQHPEIFMSPNKEPRFFVDKELLEDDFLLPDAFKKYIRKEITYTEKEYLSFFYDARNEIAIGEASADYLNSPGAPQSILAYQPSAKIIAILRNPFDAIYSDFRMKRRFGLWNEDLEFMDVLKIAIPPGGKFSWMDLVGIRLYHHHLSRYFEVFPREQVCISLFEDLAQPTYLLQSIYKFLNVSTSFEADVSIKHNVTPGFIRKPYVEGVLSSIPKSLRFLMKKAAPPALLRWFFGQALNNQESTNASLKCPESEKEYLRPLLTPDILKLQKLIGRDLRSWLA